MKRGLICLFTLLPLAACSSVTPLANSEYTKVDGNDNFEVQGNLVLPDFPIDGIIEDEYYANPALEIEMGGFVDFETHVTGKVVFGEKGLIVGFISEDKYLSSSTDYNDPQFVVNSDNVEFYIDVLNDKGKYAKPDDFAFLVNPEEYIEMRNGTGSYWSSWSGVVDYAVSVNGTINDDSDIDVGWTCELFLPYKTFGFDKESTIAVAFGCRDKATFDMYSKWTGCGPDPQNINTYISINNKGAIAQKVEDLTINNGLFEFEDDTYISSNIDALGSFDDLKIKEGTLSIDMYLPKDSKNYDNGITLQVSSRNKVFWENEGTTYYFLFISKDGDVVLGETIDGEWVAHQIYEGATYNLDGWNTFKVVFANDYMACYLNNNFLFANFAYLEELSYGLRCGATGVKYTNIVTSSSTEGGYEGINGYHISFGNFAYADNNNDKVKVNEVQDNGAILTANNKLSSGTIETAINMANANDCGIIFKLDDKRKASYWEDGVSYYFFFISKDGLLFLGKVNNGKWETPANLPISGFDVSKEYTLKVEFTENTFNCYLDNKLYFNQYDDDEVLTGQGYGLRAGSVDTVFTLF